MSDIIWPIKQIEKDWFDNNDNTGAEIVTKQTSKGKEVDNNE